jgi:hypothetical protein
MAISFRGRGGIKGYKLRFDDNPASGLQLATPIEQQVGAVIWEDQDFYRILQARRLRFQGLTVLGGLVNEDIDLSGLSNVIEYLGGPNC